MRHISLEEIWNKGRRTSLVMLTVVLLFSLTACGKNGTDGNPANTTPASETGVRRESARPEGTGVDEEVKKGLGNDEEVQLLPEKEIPETAMVMMVNDEPLSVTWEENDAVTALKELVSTEPLRIQMSMYGDFEQVGPIGTGLPAEDDQITAQAGDVVLYSGDQLVVFYGTNSWAYTRLGRITDKTAEEMEELLGNGDVTIMISMEDRT